MKSMLRFVPATAFLMCLFACLPSSAKELSVDATSSGKEVSIADGGTLTVTLETNATTGYRWSEDANISDKTVMQQAGHKYESPATPIPGAGGKEIWAFKAL